MKQLEQLDGWPIRGKLLVTAGVVTVVIAGVLLYPEACLFFVALGLVGSIVAGYWLGSRSWFLVPIVAMGIEIAIGIPATLVHPDGETPISVVLEAPFWTGVPSLIGALIGGALRAVVDRRGRSAAHNPG